MNLGRPGLIYSIAIICAIIAVSAALTTISGCGGGGSSGSGTFASSNGSSGSNPTPTPIPTPTPTPTPPPVKTLSFANPVSAQLDAGNGGGANPQIVTIADFNGDTIPDIAAANESQNNVSVFLGLGNGTFGNESLFATSADNPVAIATGDFNNDGKVDIVVATSGHFSYLLNNGTGQFPAHIDIALGTGNRGETVADFDGNGFPDVAVSDAITDTVNILFNDGSGNVNAFTPFNYNPGAGNVSNMRALIAGDFNGDGRPDLAAANFGGAFLTAWTNAGGGQANLFQAAGADKNLPLFSGSAQALTSGDFNGDGKIDIAAPSIDGANAKGRTFINSGAGFTVGDTKAISGDPFGAGSGDFNADSKLDFVSGSAFGLNNNGTGEADVLLGNGDGTLQNQVAFPVVANQQVRSIAVGDLNKDGLPDIVTAAGGTINIFINTSH